MNFYIYLTTNIINGKKYIGQHKGKPNDNYLGSGTTLKKAIQKYGKENFIKEILCYCDSREEADIKEKEYILLYNAVESNEFYNNSEGGSGGDGWRAYQNWTKKNPEQAKILYQKNSERLQEWRKNNPEDYKQKCIEPMLSGSQAYWKNHPEQLKQHLNQMNQKKIEWQNSNPQEYQKQIENWRKSGVEANSKPIICITTGEIFNSISEAGRFYNVPQSNISKCLSGKRKSAGKEPFTGKKLFWEFYKKPIDKTNQM